MCHDDVLINPYNFGKQSHIPNWRIVYEEGLGQFEQVNVFPTDWVHNENLFTQANKQET
jgi:hypothetical protein